VSILAEASVGNLEIGAEKGHPLEFYDVLDTLGTGGFAVVKRVRDKKTLEAFAMKVINVAMLENVRASVAPRQPEPNFCCDLRANLKPFPHTDD
jgi:serine/threonine protein kinase